MVAFQSLSKVTMVTLARIAPSSSCTGSHVTTIVGVCSTLIQTSLTSKLVTITALHVVPFIFVFHTKSVHTILLFIVIWLILGPSCKVSFSSIDQVKFPSTDLSF